MKKYPFSVSKNAHSIEFYYNHLKNILYSMEVGEIPMDYVRHERISVFIQYKLLPLYESMFNSRDGKVVYLTGSQIGLAKKICAWASEKRAQSLIDSGKYEYIKYC